MGTKILKLLLAAAIVTALSLGSGNDAAAHGRRTHTPSPAPHVISQRQDGNVRVFYVHNPLPKAIWLYFECEGVLTQTPIGMGREHTAEIKVAGIDEVEQCSLNHYRIQVKGQSPPTWDPAAFDGGVGQ